MVLMTRHLGSRIVRALLAVACLLPVGAPAVQGHHGAGATDPRCLPGAPAEPGVDLTALCAEQLPQAASDQLDPGSTRLIPFIGAALVTGIALSVVAVIAMRYRRPVRPARMTRKAWWVCPSCHSMNAGDRLICYGCQAPAPSAVVTGHAAPASPAAAAPPSDADPVAAPALDQPVGRPAG